MIELQNVPQTSMDLLRLIIINQMGLAKDRVNIYDEKWKIPPDDDLFIVLEYRSGKCIANRNTFIGEDETEVQDVNMLEHITVGVFSRNRTATQRKEEVLMAILSSYAQGLQEKYAFKIARAGSIEDLSALEGTAMLKRYDIDLTVFAWYTKTISPDYFSSYRLQVIVDTNGSEITRNIDQFLVEPT